MESTTRLISVVGKRNSGKTTLIVALAAEFTKRGKRVGTLKHGTHPATLDIEGTDTWRHFNEGMAERVVLESAGQRVLFQRLEEETDPVMLSRQFMQGLDLVIAEGFTMSSVPKIEVFRRQAHESSYFDPTRPNAGAWFAAVTDDSKLDFPFPSFCFTDTGWLVTLCSLAWERAMLIDE